MNQRSFTWKIGMLALWGSLACSSRDNAHAAPGAGTRAPSEAGQPSGSAGVTVPAAGSGATGSAGVSAGGHSNAGALAAGSGASGAQAGGGAAGTSSNPAADGCDPGTTTTTWASACPTSVSTPCTAGTWTAAGSNTGDPLVLESAHFAIYAPNGTVTQAQAQAAIDMLEMKIWPALMGAPILFPEPYCATADKHKVSIVIHSDYGLTGGGWGNGNLGMWIGPGATADHWGLAHEFTHALQTATGGLENSKYTGWIFESHANWHAHQLAEYHGSNVHCSEMLPNFPHLYLGSTRDRYCNWQFMEYLKDKYCYSAVADMWSKAPKAGAAQSGADPFSVIQSNMGWSAGQLNDFFGEWAMHNVTWDYQNPDGSDQGAVYRKNYGAITDVAGNAPGAPQGFRRLRLTRLDPMESGTSRYVTPSAWAPQRWGYNVVRLHADSGATSVTVRFRGVLQAQAASSDFGNYDLQPASVGTPDSDWRWGLVAVDASGSKPRYSAMQHGSDAELTFCIGPADGQLFLVVMATPSSVQKIMWDQMYYTVYRYPWMIELDGAKPDGFEASAPNPSKNGQKWANGGGWVAAEAKVDSSVYVGPYAQVLGGTVTAQARIDEHATIISGSVGGMATVKGLSVVTGLSVSGSGVVATVFQGPGTFESGQSVSGTGQIWGDMELRGQGMQVTKGVYYGFVDSSTLTANPSQGANRSAPSPEVTSAPPYAWRP